MRTMILFLVGPGLSSDFGRAAAPSPVGAGETAGGVIMRYLRREEMCGLLPEVDRIVRCYSVKGGIPEVMSE
jgi:hypothetical protein